MITDASIHSILFILPFAIPFGSLYPLPFSGANLTVADALIALIIILGFTRGVVERRIIIPRLSLSLPFAFFFGAVLLSLLAAASFEAFAKELVKWAELFLAYLFVAREVDERGALALLVAIFLAGSAEAIIGIYQYSSGIGPRSFILPGGTNIRAFGTFEQPNPFAGYLALIAPVALGVILSRIQGLRRGIHNSIAFYAILLTAFLALALGLAAIWASFSRGAWIAVAAALVVTIVLLSKRAAGLFALGVVLVIVVALLGELNLIPPIVADRFSAVADYVGVFDVRGVTVNDTNYAIVERMAHWQAAWDMFLDHPWLGVGFGNYAVAYPAYSLPRWDDPLGHAHNYFLNVLAETGAVGAFAYFGLWVAIFGLGWRAVRRGNSTWRPIAAGLCGALVALTIHNLFDNLFVHSMQIQVGITLGLLANIAERKWQ